MKIGIVTLPFNWNYGGILQTYALQSVLKKLGHEPITINRDTVVMPLKMKIFSFLRRLFLRVIFRKKVVVRTWAYKSEEKLIRQHTDRFIRENIKTTDLFASEKDFKSINQYKFDAFIVGSDQVWRPKYSPSLKNHFLGFLSANDKSLRIAYAASFGVENWEYNDQQTKRCSLYAKKFSAISVRENSAISLCKDYLGVNSTHVLDPTMLIPKEEYIELVHNDKIPSHDGKLFNYVLDSSPDIKKIIDLIASELSLKPFSSTARGSFRDLGQKHISDCVFPPITAWIRGFMDADFVVTDSFHGTAMSIVFNKPFLSIGNRKRGITRFKSLLSLFGIENRLVYEFDQTIETIIQTPIDYLTVNKKMEQMKQHSILFLQNALNS